MDFSRLVEFYERLESTTKRLEMREILVELFREADPEEAGLISYMTLGTLHPPYIGIELGMAEKLALRAVRMVTDVDEDRLDREVKAKGDIGTAVETLLAEKKSGQTTLLGGRLTVQNVYAILERITKVTGEGAVDVKVKLLAGILAHASPKEARYILRLVTGKMRLGVADQSILDALSVLYGVEKSVIERAYNITSDIGLVVKVAKSAGIEGLSSIRMAVGRAVKPMLAERLSDSREILEKLGGRGLAEYKYDGERMQIHKDGERILIFSRRQENITSQYPDVQGSCRERIICKSCILECEAVAVDRETGQMLPFQELMHRRRKYDVEKAAKHYPVGLFFFDALMIDGEELIDRSLSYRRKKLSEVLEQNEHFTLTRALEVTDPDTLENFLLHAIEDGCEGLIVKDLSEKSIYRAGARGWLWIKYKRSYVSKLVDTLDLTVIGAFYGTGKRAGRYGTLLMAAYDQATDTFKSICKVGTGFKDEDLERITEMLKPYVVPKRPPRVDSEMEPDVWIQPSFVLEIIGDEITLSPIHTAARGLLQRNAGLAIRFPRFTGKYRLDKSPEDSTTVEEVVEMYRSQLKRVEEGRGEAT
ncbi:MAG: ATP-dependent DNA ligase [Aigarchaeota archaeon]|nr:ATP-dependent DNA ligase [Aigarchaeota archaeon]MDW8092397.1 ATP-dependent DNA ligase [Nitrososphaerota archaeon]